MSNKPDDPTPADVTQENPEQHPDEDQQEHHHTVIGGDNCT